ncbi:MAG: phosphatase PAP2 family protein [Gammaproteobacteria bacterium]|nr:MAG: phosphatase PAP2 family protein [Gammaproteobacteria bacterium]
MSLSESVLAWMAANPDGLVLGILLLSMIESLAIAGMIVPGVVLLLGASGVAGSVGIPIWQVLMAGVIGALLGDGISFLLGRLFHERIRTLWPLSRYPKLLDQGEAFFRDHGGKSILIGRFVGPLRAIIPLIAGMMGMSGTRFLVFNLISALGWAPLYLLPGYGIGLSLGDEREVPEGFYPTLLLLVAILAGLAALFSWLHWHVRPQGRLYDWLEKHGRRSALTRLWLQRMASERHGQREYPLPSLLLAIFSPAAFALLALLVSHGHRIWNWNHWVADWFQQIDTPMLRAAAALFTTLGDPAWLYVAFGLMVATLWLAAKHRAAVVTVLVAGIATHATTTLLKVWLAIPRPEGAPLESAAFPSGHAAGATVWAGLLASFIAREQASEHRWRIYAVAACIPLLTGLTRIALGVHWWTDVVAGWFWGLFIVACARVLFSPWDRRPLWPSHVWLRLLGATGVAWVLYAVVRLPATLALYGAIAFQF